MDRTADELVRQQYLVPRRSVAKLRQLSRAQRVSATEIVRRAIDAYDPPSVDRAAREAAALDLLGQVHGELRKALRRIDADLTALRTRAQALDDGSLRKQARRDTESWLRRNPHVLAAAETLFGPPGSGRQPSDARRGNGAPRHRRMSRR